MQAVCEVVAEMQTLMTTFLKPYSSSAHCTASMLFTMYRAPSRSARVGPGSCSMQ